MMRRKEIENRLSRAVNSMRPDADALLSACADQADKKEACIPMTTQQLPIKKTRKTWIPITAAAAACVVLLGGGLGVFGYMDARRPDAVVGLDVNPSIELTINRKDRVLDATAVNSDAEALLDGMELQGVPLDVAINALIGSLYKNGYIGENANSVLVSVEGAGEQRGATLQEQVTEEIRLALASQSVEGAILTQEVQQDAELQAWADENNISLGKAALVRELTQCNPLLDASELATLSVQQLSLLADSMQSQLTGVSTVGTASEDGYIGRDKALELAAARAGVDAGAVTQVEIEMDYEDGRMIYEVEFRHDSHKYEADVDALTGDILDYEDSWKAGGSSGNTAGQGTTQAQGTTGGQTADTTRPQTSQTTAAQSQDIGRDAALEAACRHAGVQTSAVTAQRIERDVDDGVPVFEVDFTAGNVRYEYEIHALTGAVREAKNQTVKTAASASAGGTADVGRDAALAAALEHAGVQQADIRDLEVDRDVEHGTLVYEVSFESGRMEYEYLIEASTGAVLHWESEQDD